jgi:hypothetical protein
MMLARYLMALLLAILTLLATGGTRSAEIPETLADPYRIERGMQFDSFRMRQLLPPAPTIADVTYKIVEPVEFFVPVEPDLEAPSWRRYMPLSENETSEAELERRAREELVNLARFGTGAPPVVFGRRTME